MTAASLQSGPPPAPLQTPEFRNTRPLILGPEAPQPPFPIALAGPVQKGFGRGGKELGCPTANLPDESIFPLSTVAKTGVYYGYAQIIPPESQRTALDIGDLMIYPMVMSLGWNPFYKNERLSAEVHIMHNFKADFYGYEMRALVLGYIRPELDYTSREALIQDIELDKKVALNSLDRPAYRENASHSHFARGTPRFSIVADN
jgi:riboflavin kinase